jgi:hypothetical protein
MRVFYCSTCFESYYIHPHEPATVCRCIVVSVCTAVLVRFGWSRVVSECRLVHLSPAPKDECNNIRNMLSNKKTPIKWHQVGSIYSTTKMMHGPINIRFKNKCRPNGPSSDSQEWKMNARFTMEIEVISSLYIAYNGADWSKYVLQCWEPWTQRQARRITCLVT